MASQSSTLTTDQDPKYSPGEIAPAEGTPQKQNPPELGPNNEKLEDVYPTLVSTLRELVLSYRTEGIVARRHEIRRVRQAHLFWDSIQYGYFSATDWEWHLPFGTSVGLGLGVEDPAEAETPRYQFVTNIYQAFGLSFIALMSTHIPTVVFYPQSAQNERDITTAKAADDVRELIEKNNRPKKLLAKVAWLMWCDGKVGGYVRYVADGQRFGWQNVDDMEAQPQQMGQGSYICPTCGTPNDQEPENQDGGQGFGMGATPFCKQCGTEMTDEDFAAPTSVQVPRVTQTRRLAKGQEVISIIPGLEFHTPVWADERHEFPYLQWNLEVHIARLKAAYPHVAKKITAAGPISADDTFARASRIAVKQSLPSTHPGDSLTNLVTFSRTWIRPWCFWLVEDEAKRQQLLDLFPDGCYIAFAGETYCESRNESMDDYWRVLQAMPGDGQNRPAVGSTMIPINEQYNTLSNIEAETYEFGIPPILADAETIDFDALEETTAEPGTWYPVSIRPQEDIAKKVLQLQPATVPPDMIARRQELMGPIGQFLTGITPTVFGAQLEGNDTARAYELAREMAMGRITLFWNELKCFYAELMLLGVQCFRDNRPEDIEVSDKENGQFKSKWLRLADLKGNIEIYDDPDETYPELPSQVRAMITQLIEDPVFGAMLMKSPANVETAKTFLGLDAFVAPEEDSRIKQMREIEQMLAGAGPVPGQPQMDPMSGAVVPGQPESSVQVDLIMDEHAIESAECKRWANSDAGQTAKVQNPQAYEDIRFHKQAHDKAAEQLQGGEQQKPPSESINYKDLPPDGQAQMAGQAGIHLDPAALEAKQQQDKAEKAAQMKAKLNQGPGKTAIPSGGNS